MKKSLASSFHLKYSKRDRFVIKQIAIFYGIGIVGFWIPFTHSFFTKLTPLALILSVVLLYYYNENRLNWKKSLYFLFVFFASFIIEVLGVKTGAIFGSYRYGSGLGLKLFETPILIGINWALMVYMSSAVFSKRSKNFFFQVVLSYFLMLFYDFILEHSASKMDMWYWAGNQIPVSNYLMWFFIAIVFQAIRYFSKIEIANKIAMPLFFIQMIFFLIIQIV